MHFALVTINVALPLLFCYAVDADTRKAEFKAVPDASHLPRLTDTLAIPYDLLTGIKESGEALKGPLLEGTLGRNFSRSVLCPVSSWYRTVIVAYSQRGLANELIDSLGDGILGFAEEGDGPLDEEENLNQRNNILSRLDEILQWKYPEYAAEHGIAGEDGSKRKLAYESRIFQSTYLNKLNMEVIKVPESIPIRNFLRELFEDERVTGGWPDEILEGAADVDLGGYPEEPIMAMNDSFINQTKLRRRLTPVPDDVYYNEQWAHTDSNQFGIRTPETWNLWTGIGERRPFVVALIDSGVNYNHPDLQGRLWTNPNEICGNGIDDDGNGYVDDCMGWNFLTDTNDPQDENGHGTASAGIIAATPNNKIGVTPVCWNCKVMNLKALNKELKGTVSGFVQALNYALQMKVRVSNNSYGGRGSRFRGLESAVQRAQQMGMIFITAAGNYRSSNDPNSPPGSITYPSSYGYSNMISVAAITRLGRLAPFSSFGRSSVQLGAPGEGILSTALGNRYRRVDGTSFAVPFVTATVAMIMDKYPHLHYSKVVSMIVDNVRKTPQLNGFLITGGTLDTFNAFRDAHYSSAMATSCQSLTACPLNSQCVVDGDGFSCRCNLGYEPLDGKCVDIDECKIDGVCPANANCVNTIGSYDCRCSSGYKSDGDQCIDIDECRLTAAPGRFPNSRVCPDMAVCVNLPGTYDCRCPPGSAWNANEGGIPQMHELTNPNYAFPRSKCLLIESPPAGPCVNNGLCGPNALCMVSGLFFMQSAVCECLDGYESRNDVCVRRGMKNTESYLAVIKVSEELAKGTPSDISPTVADSQCWLGFCLYGQLTTVGDSSQLAAEGAMPRPLTREINSTNRNSFGTKLVFSCGVLFELSFVV